MIEATRTTRSFKILLDVGEVEISIGITFVADQHWESLIPSRFRDIDQLQVRPKCVYDWLEASYAIHPSNSSIAIDDSPSAVRQLNLVTEKLILNSEILSSDTEIYIDKFATERPANQPVTEDEINECDANGKKVLQSIPQTVLQ